MLRRHVGSADLRTNLFVPARPVDIGFKSKSNAAALQDPTSLLCHICRSSRGSFPVLMMSMPRIVFTQLASLAWYVWMSSVLIGADDV